MTKISDYVDDGTSKPIQDADLLDFSNDTDGGTTYDVSKKILVSELAAFLGALGAIPQDIVVTGTGTGAGASVMKAGEIGGDGLYFAASNYFNEDDYMGYQDNTTGSVYHNAVGSMTFTVDNGQRILVITDGKLEIARGNSNQIVEIGNSIDFSSGAKLHVHGETDDNTKPVLVLTKNDTPETPIFTALCDGFVSLEFGTGVNNISTDGTAAANSDNKLMTEKAIVTLISGGTQIIGGVTLSSSSTTNISSGAYVTLADTTTVTSVTSGIGQDSNWTLEVTQAGITNQKGVVTFTGNLEKDGGGGANYDVAIFKNGSIVSESEQIDQKLESGGKGQSVTAMAIIEFSTNDTFDIRVSGNGTADDIFCGGGTLFIQ